MSPRRNIRRTNSRKKPENWTWRSKRSTGKSSYNFLVIVERRVQPPKQPDPAGYFKVTGLHDAYMSKVTTYVDYRRTDFDNGWERGDRRAMRGGLLLCEQTKRSRRACRQRGKFTRFAHEKSSLAGAYFICSSISQRLVVVRQSRSA